MSNTLSSNLPLVGRLSFDIPGVDADRIATLAKDAAYVTVGLSVLALQKVQVRRLELTDQVRTRVEAGRQQFDAAVKQVGQNSASIDARVQRFEDRLDQIVGHFAAQLPEPAESLVTRAHDAAKAARRQVRELISA